MGGGGGGGGSRCMFFCSSFFHNFNNYFCQQSTAPWPGNSSTTAAERMKEFNSYMDNSYTIEDISRFINSTEKSKKKKTPSPEQVLHPSSLFLVIPDPSQKTPWRVTHAKKPEVAMFLFSS